METARPGDGVLGQLKQLAQARGLDELATRLHLAQSLVEDDLLNVSEVLTQLPARDVVQRSARHLLSHGGKRLRPLCVALCARLGGSADAAAVRDVMAAAELLHNATLLHDDVVDVGDTRRGSPTARTIYGNAASVYAGDWLLLEALRRVRAHELPGTFDALLVTIDEMIAAEAVQLAGRGRLRADRDTYFSVVRGKTASLFRWACFAGAKAGKLDEDQCAALAAYGEHVGLAFQLVDDLLDFEGDRERTGKELFADLREGKATYPLIVLLEREPAALELLLPFVGENATARPEAMDAVLVALKRTGAIEESLELARHHIDSALKALERLPETPASDALRALALATIHRDR